MALEIKWCLLEGRTRVKKHLLFKDTNTNRILEKILGPIQYKLSFFRYPPVIEIIYNKKKLSIYIFHSLFFFLFHVFFIFKFLKQQYATGINLFINSPTPIYKENKHTNQK